MQSTRTDDPPLSERTGAQSATQVVILAAGKGTRMKSSLPKVLHPLRGAPLIAHSLRLARAVTDALPIVVVGHDAQAVAAAVGQGGQCVVQSPQLGTGHAVMAVADHFAATGALPPQRVVVMAADMPLVRPETVSALVEEQTRSGAALVLLSVTADQPRGFGRIVRDAAGEVYAIVEEIDCTAEQRAIRELNASVYCFDGPWLWQAVRQLQPNPRKGEYFLTDLVTVAVREGRRVKAWMGEAEESIGINTLADLADADAVLRRRINRTHMLNGVRIVDPATTYIDLDVEIEAEVQILPNTHLMGSTRVGAASVIGPNSVLRDAIIGRRCRVRQSTVEEARMDDDSDAGPYAHLRPGAHVCAGAHVGNYAEIKNSTLGAGSRMGHFSYLGDATVGANVNIGAGAITCNYDGVNKHPTVIEDDVFIGSDTMLVAPVTVGKGARTGAGAVVTRNVPPDTLVVGLPARAIRKLKAGS
ncbi:MAG: bifunctional UDP-N-acetylglucosamine diphosphorylase/glucosamine-1-phosphate N-acetyltransferase GlmU [Anaerolineae bacterium]|nr:bifunctional UDP-N-acetylglucosamine diphosphorylase/glucosamine-1-phosphate N-acetyltransferase GlmU [Thermoflexales bacterium]MDW8408144.1 bifunctional UDP-N-acetylglucosamine diphosphorylase/glucosamine-1-phosphate N-acetyltransferase GlmU [Anaerolineae bacterium]